MIDENTKKEFLVEAESLTEELYSNINSLDLLTPEQTGKSFDMINTVFRAAHSLKGLSGMLGFKKIADLSHDFESLLDNLRMGKIELYQQVIDVMFETTDILNRLLEEVKTGTDQYSIAPILVKIHNLSSRSTAVDDGNIQNIIDIDPDYLNVLTEYEEHRLKENTKQKSNIYKIHLSYSFDTFDQELTHTNDLLKAEGEIITTLPNIHSEDTDNINFIILFSSKLEESSVSEILKGTRYQLVKLKYKHPADYFLRPAAETSHKKEIFQGLEDAEHPLSPEYAQEDIVELKSISQTVRVDIKKLDTVMNIIGDLILSKTQISRIARDLIAMEGYSAIADELHKASKILERRFNELQKSVIEIRMVPIGQKINKLSRIVRKTAREMNKNISFSISGEETELDKVVVEEIADPILHIIRNAIDHGIEPSDERIATGKAGEGQIHLDAYQKGNNVIIDIIDDGRGIDKEKILKTAKKKGLADDISIINDREVFNLLFLPGFSTKEDVNALSGRGVGMDVVKKNITDLRGTIEISSEKGKGTTVRLVLPITMAIIQALLVRVKDEKYALPMSSVIESSILDTRDISTVENREVIFLRGKPYPILRLGDVFNVPDPAEQTRNEEYIIYVQSGDIMIGIVVSEMLGQEEIVIKSIGDLLINVPGIAGATELGDKKPILVVDVGILISNLASKGSIPNV